MRTDDPSERLELRSVNGTGTTATCLHAYVDSYYIGAIVENPRGWHVSSNLFEGATVPTLDEAREVMRLWVALGRR